VGRRDTKNSIALWDLVVVVYPFMEWKWQRYKIGDIGVVTRIIHYSDYSVAYIKLFRTGKTEPVPLDYIALLGDENGSGRPSGSL